MYRIQCIPSPGDHTILEELSEFFEMKLSASQTSTLSPSPTRFSDSPEAKSPSPFLGLTLTWPRACKKYQHPALVTITSSFEHMLLLMQSWYVDASVHSDAKVVAERL